MMLVLHQALLGVDRVVMSNRLNNINRKSRLGVCFSLLFEMDVSVFLTE
jgi:hypothetical protein